MARFSGLGASTRGKDFSRRVLTLATSYMVLDSNLLMPRRTECLSIGFLLSCNCSSMSFIN